MKFKVGDRVLAIDNIGKFQDWTEGVVSEVPTTSPNYRVRFPCGVNLYVKDSESIKPLPSGGNHKIVITADGNTTLARLYEGNKVVKRSEAKRSPSDTFSFQTGAELAFKRLFENPVEKPEPPKAELAPEPKTEPVKLYCVKDCDRMFKATKGKIYELNADGAMMFDNELSHSGCPTWDTWKDANPDYVPYFVPLVNRPAKVGEWVYLTGSGGFSFANEGDVKRVDGVVLGKHIQICDRQWGYRESKPDYLWNFMSSEYLVLDGYQPEEKKPEFYNGKVVCVECPSDTGPYTPGKIYTFKDGFTCDDNGNKRPSMFARNNPRTEGFHDFDDLKNFTFARFIEYKGEA